MSWEFLSNPVLIWFIIGLILLLLELAIPGLFLIFFGVGAWITSIACAIFNLDLDVQVWIFAITSVVTLLLLRKYLKKKFFKGDKSAPDTLDDEFIGKKAIAQTDFEPEIEGKVEFKGTNWKAISKEKIKKGEYVKILEKDSITLIVEPLKKEN